MLRDLGLKGRDFGDCAFAVNDSATLRCPEGKGREQYATDNNAACQQALFKHMGREWTESGTSETARVNRLSTHRLGLFPRPFLHDFCRGLTQKVSNIQIDSRTPFYLQKVILEAC